MSDGATYRIKQGDMPDSAVCECGHVLVAHGSSGYMCCRCVCKRFELKKKRESA